MTADIPEEDAALWKSLVDQHRAFVSSRMKLLSKRKNLVELVRSGLHDPSERAVAMDVVHHLDEDQQKQLFPELLSLSSYVHGLTDSSIHLIKSLPRSWVLENIQEHAEPILRQGTHEEYRLLLRLYEELNPDLARELATQASQHVDPDIREAGEDFLVRISEE